MVRLLAALLCLGAAGCKKPPPVRCVSQADCPVRQICLERLCVDPASVGIHAVKPGSESAERAEEPAPAPASGESSGSRRRSPSALFPAATEVEPPSVSRGASPRQVKQRVEGSLQRWDTRVGARGAGE